MSIGFVVVLWLSIADTWLDLDPAPELAELRHPADWPDVAWNAEALQELPKQLEAYYDDHFGFRDTLVRLGTRLRLATGSNLYDTEVIVGKENWLFINAGGGLLDDRRGVRLYDPTELEATTRQLVGHRDLLAERRIPYLFVLAPDKHSIYPEFLPDRIRRANEQDRTDQLVEHLSRTTDLEILDLRAALLSRKAEDSLYPSNGSHWNDLGAYYAYAAIQDRVGQWFDGVDPMPLEAFEITRQRRRGDLARMLGLTDLLLSDYPYLQFRDELRATRTVAGLTPLQEKLPPHRQPFAFETGDRSLPNAVIFRDSFTNALAPFLSQHYQRVAYYWTAFLPDVVYHEAPDLVLEIRAERQATRISR